MLYPYTVCRLKLHRFMKCRYLWVLPLFFLLALPVVSMAEDTANASTSGRESNAAKDAITLQSPKEIPEFTVFDAEGKPFASQELKGKPSLLVFWATWCAPCVKEMPALDRLQTTLGEGFRILPVAQDYRGVEGIRAFYERHQIQHLPIYNDEKGKAFQALKARGVPTALIIDAEGRERARIEGLMDWEAEAVVKTLRSLMAEDKGAK
jgi:thiol-disulfide isomerase/thioredoxin